MFLSTTAAIPAGQNDPLPKSADLLFLFVYFVPSPRW
jgi:hypothetical protein